MMLPETILQDLRYGARMLWRNAGFTMVSVLALAIGIGVNTAAFTAYKAFFKRSLDARESGRMVNLAVKLHSGSGDQAAIRRPRSAFLTTKLIETGSLFQRPDRGEHSAEPNAYRSGGNLSRRSTRWFAGGKTGAASARHQTWRRQVRSGLGELFFRSGGRTHCTGGPSRLKTSELAASPSALISDNYWQKRFGGIRRCSARPFA